MDASARLDAAYVQIMVCLRQVHSKKTPARLNIEYIQIVVTQYLPNSFENDPK